MCYTRPYLAGSDADISQPPHTKRHSMTLDHTLGILGFGNMGAAILHGLLKRATLVPGQAIVFDSDSTKTDAAAELGVGVAESPSELAQKCSVLLLATKPQDIEQAVDAITQSLNSQTLILSVAAGISIGYFQRKFGPECRVVRVMPNTPALVGAGAAGLAFSENCTPKDKEVAIAIFEAIGIAEEVREEDIDIITALSGSGPAYFFLLVEALVDAAVKEGLDRECATRLAVQTCFGAGRMLKTSSESPAELRIRVTSKGGTTAAALDHFQGHGFEETVHGAVAAAAKRSKELGA